MITCIQFSTITPIVIAAVVIATIVPVVVLAVIYKLDLYRTGAFYLVLLALGWGILAHSVACQTNARLFNFFALRMSLPLSAFDRLTAPINEEIIKALILVVLVRQRRFTYFVDGAIYGFAIGIGFAMLENYEYVGLFPGQEIVSATQRVYTTNLIHASASSLMGIGLGLARFREGAQHWLLPPAMLLIAIAFHSLFNTLATCGYVGACPAIFYPAAIAGWHHILRALYVTALSAAGVATIVWIIRQGLRNQRDWVREKILDIDRMTAGEARLAQDIAGLGDLLKPVEERFGKEKARLSERLIILQAQLSIVEKTHDDLPSGKDRQRAEERIEEIYAEMTQLRADLGMYCMLFVRHIYPIDVPSLWAVLEDRIKQEQGTGVNWMDTLEIRREEVNQALAEPE